MAYGKLLLFSLLALVGLSASAAAGEVALRFHGRGGAAGVFWPVSFGVPFPEGVLQDGGRVQLVGPDGASVPLQARTTARWFDGSVRWILLDAQLPVPEGTDEYLLKWGADAAPLPPREGGVAWSEGGGLLEVDTGPMRVSLSTEDMRGIAQVRVRGGDGQWRRLFPEETSADIFLEKAGGEAYRGSWAEPPKVAVEEAGPSRVAVKVEGWHRSEQGEDLNRRILRFYFYEGKRSVRLYDTFVKTACSAEAQYRNISLHLPFQGSLYRFEGAGMDRPVQASEGGDYLLQHKHDEFVRVADGERAFVGERAPGSVTVSDGETAYTVTRRHFREMFPSEFEVEEGMLKLHLWPRHGRPAEHLGENMNVKNVGHLWWVHEGEVLDFTVPEEVRQFQGYRRDDDLENVIANAFSSAPHWRRPPQDRFISNAFGIARTVEYWLDFHGEAGGGAGRETFRAAPLVVVDPEWLAASGAFWNIAARSEHYAEVEDALEKTLEFLPAMYERIGDYGLWNYGAYHQDYHPTLEYALVHRHWKGFHHGGPRWPWLAFARSGKPEHFDFAWIHANHLLDVCVVNWECDEFNEQAAEVHAVRSLKFRGAHRRYKGLVHWWEGFARNYNSIADFALWTYYMTGYQRAWDVAMDMGEYLVAPYGHWPDNRFRQNRNGTSRGSAALSLYRATHDERYLEAAKDHMQYFRDAVEGQIEGGGGGLRAIYYAPFLERYWQLVGDESLEPYIVRWAQYRADLGSWSERWPGSPWTGRDPFYNLMALGYELTGDAGFLRRGLHEARVLLDNRGANADPDLEGVLIHYYGGNPGYTAQQWGDFVKALDTHYERTGERLELSKTPDSLLHSFRFRAFRGHRDADGNRFRRLVFHTRKADGEEVSIRFPLRTQNPVEAVARGPGGVVKREALVPEDGQCEFALELSAVDPAGDYRIEFFCGELVGRGDLVTLWPLPGNYRKLVKEMPFDASFREAGRFYFLPRPGEEGRAKLRLRTAPHFMDRYYVTHNIYDPEGERILAATGQGHVNAPLDVPFEAEDAGEGRLWLYSGGSLGFGHGAWIEGDVHRAVSFSPAEFFVPQTLAEE